MAGTLTFNVGAVRVLMAHTKAATAHAPSYDDLFNPKCHKGGRIVEKDGWPESDTDVFRLKVTATSISLKG